MIGIHRVRSKQNSNGSNNLCKYLAGSPAEEVLVDGFKDLRAMCEIFLSKFESAIEDYEKKRLDQGEADVETER